MTNQRVASKSDVLALLVDNSADLRRFGVRQISLFGSFVTDSPRGDSDVDLLVSFDPGQKSFDNFMSLNFFLEDLLGRRVELVTRESLSPYLGPRILETSENVPLAA
ncbi:MAG: nucleotidyltransferase [Wenzhouxiangella sp.]|nr:MAG: nucleotidyltransferase [Wenzhouxiangella sp.]